MDCGWQHRLGFAAGVLLTLCGCSSLPAPSQPAGESPQVVAPVAPVIPPPVPVEVAPALEAPSPEAAAEVAAVVPETPATTEAQPPVPARDLLVRVRNGFALQDHRNTRIDREADWFARHPEYMERVFTRAAPYLHYIVGEVESRGMPLEIAQQPFIESAFQPYAYSRARASGLWQFMAATGGRYGLKQDWWYDGRRDVVAATQAALDYLQFLHGLFDGNWLHAVAAYNCGEGNVAKAIRRNRAAGKRTDFWNLRLPNETRGYVPRLLAMSRLVADPEQYALSIEGIPDEPYFVRVETGGQISIAVAAELAGISTEEMYDLNPAYHRWATDPTGPHFLLVPVESAEAFQQSLLQLTPDQRLRVERYAVREGDTVTTIAQRFGTTAQHLRELNGLGTTDTIALAAELRVPSAVAALPPQVLQAAARVDSRSRTRSVRAVHVVRRGDSLWTIAQRHNMDVITLAKLNRIDPTDTIKTGQRLVLNANAGGTGGSEGIVGDDGRRVTYVVRRGDTLSEIARTLRVSVASLREWNNLAGSVIRPGQKLIAFVPRRS